MRFSVPAIEVSVVNDTHSGLSQFRVFARHTRASDWHMLPLETEIVASFQLGTMPVLRSRCVMDGDASADTI